MESRIQKMKDPCDRANPYNRSTIARTVWNADYDANQQTIEFRTTERKNVGIEADSWHHHGISFVDPDHTASTTSLSLLARVRSDDPQAWQRLLNVYGPLVFHWCERTGLNAADSADVMQDVFAAVSKSISTFGKTRRRDSFRGWLWTITRNKVRDFCRRRARQVGAAGGTNAYLQLAAVAEQLSDDSLSVTNPREVSGVLHRTMEMVRSEFEARTWDAFWRSAVDEEPTAEIAESLGITANAVRQAKSRVLRRLRQELGESPG